MPLIETSKRLERDKTSVRLERDYGVWPNIVLQNSWQEQERDY